MATITEDYVSFETAKLLKEKAFDEVCYRIYDTKEGELLGTDGIEFQNHEADEETITAPTLQMAMKWLREVHNLYIEICTDKAHNFKDIVFRPAIYNKDLNCLWESDNFSTYEEACEAAIKYCLKHLI